MDRLVKDYSGVIDKIVAEMERAVVGKTELLRMVLIAFLAEGHILFEDYPGLGKTLIARSFALVTGLDFKRVQFTPDLLPFDILGSTVFNRDNSDFKFKKGPIFTQMLLADEINRASPKTQSALLEAMQEKNVTLEGETHALPAHFFVMATQNPMENEGTFPLPEAQLDRFMVKLSVGYLSSSDEWRLLKNRTQRRHDDVELRTVTSPQELEDMKVKLNSIAIHDDVLRYIVNLVSATREDPCVEVGASPRSLIGLAQMGRGVALSQGRDFVTPDDIKVIFPSVVRHRFFLKPEYWIDKDRKEKVIESILRSVPVPLLQGSSL